MVDYSKFDKIEEDEDNDDDFPGSSSRPASSQAASGHAQSTQVQTRREAFEKLNQLMGNLAGDAQLQQDLRHPAVLRAINHWTGRERLSSEVPFELDPSRSSPVADPA